MEVVKLRNNSEIFKNVNEVEVSVNDLRALVLRLKNFTKEESTFKAITIKAAELANLDSEKTMVLVFRLRALGNIVDSGELSEWVRQGKNKKYLEIDDAIVYAAAKTPLQIDESQVYFDVEEFKKNIITH
jgi:hypothetical protein